MLGHHTSTATPKFFEIVNEGIRPEFTIPVRPPPISSITDVYFDNKKCPIAQYKIIRDAVASVKNGTEFGPWPLHRLEVRDNRVICPLNGKESYFVQNWRIIFAKILKNP